MKNRVKELRKKLDLSQQDFAESIGLSRNFVARVEMGERELSSRTINDIARVHNVNPDWLETGNGEMFIEMGIEDQIAAFAGDMMKLPNSDPRKIILRTLAELPEDRWKELADMLMDAAKRTTANVDNTE